MYKCLFRSIIFFMVLCNVYSIYIPQFRKPEVLDALEEMIIFNKFYNCSIYENPPTKIDPIIEKVKVEIVNRLSLIHINSEQKVVHKLHNAHSTIPSSPLYNSSEPLTIFIPGFAKEASIPIYFPLFKNVKHQNISNFYFLELFFITTNVYYNFVNHSQIVGEKLGETFTKLYENGIRNFRCIGYSLGAHICGIIGKVFEKNTSQMFDRITGLEPGGLCHSSAPPELRLTSDDAKFIDVINTNMYGIGSRFHIGHVEFNPNGGQDVLGCTTSLCSHTFMIFYFAESIVNNNFIAVKCSDWETFVLGKCKDNERVVMGYWTPSDVPHGKYFLTVNSVPKFARGEEGIVKSINEIHNSTTN